jgi:hypothetical protein
MLTIKTLTFCIGEDGRIVYFHIFLVGLQVVAIFVEQFDSDDHQVKVNLLLIPTSVIHHNEFCFLCVLNSDLFLIAVCLLLVCPVTDSLFIIMGESKVHSFCCGNFFPHNWIF